MIFLRLLHVMGLDDSYARHLLYTQAAILAVSFVAAVSGIRFRSAEVHLLLLK